MDRQKERRKDKGDKANVYVFTNLMIEHDAGMFKEANKPILGGTAPLYIIVFRRKGRIRANSLFDSLTGSGRHFCSYWRVVWKDDWNGIDTFGCVSVEWGHRFHRERSDVSGINSWLNTWQISYCGLVRLISKWVEEGQMR